MSQSLRDIQAAYFETLEQVFGEPFSEMKKHGTTCQEIAADLASRERMVVAFEHDSQSFFGAFAEFWDRYRDVVDQELSQLTCLKTVYGGDLSPSYTHNIALSVGLYMDTTVIPDPVLRIADFGATLTAKDRLYFTAKHSLNALTYKDLALADVDPPIVVINSGALRASRPALQELMTLADKDLRSHFGRVFNRSFTSDDELISFLAKFKSVEQFAAAVSDRRRVLFDLDWPEDPLEQIRRHMEDTGSRFTDEAQSLMHERPPGLLIYDLLRGRFMQANDIIVSSERLNGTPLVDAPTSWQYLTWKYQYNLDQEPTEPALDDHLLIVRALQSINDDDRLRVLRASPDVLINLRRNGVLGDLREMLRTGIHNIESAAPSDVEGVTTAIAAAFGSAMQGHQKKLDELVNAGIRWYGLKLAPMVVSASISILGAATGNIPMATIGAVTSALGAPTAKDVLKDGKRIIAGYRRLRRSAAGILFRNV